MTQDNKSDELMESAEEFTFSAEAKEKLVADLTLERYRYVLQQVRSANENLYRFLSIYQALATLLVGAQVALFTNRKQWAIQPEVLRFGIIGLTVLVTVMALFTIMLILLGVQTWWHYRVEECDIAEKAAYPGFRKRPRMGNLFRWHETYIVGFIILSVTSMWFFVVLYAIPKII